MRKTKRWQIRFWQTFIGIIEVDAHNAYKYFKDPDCTNHAFIMSVAMALIDNTRGAQEAPLRRRRNPLRQATISSAKKISTKKKKTRKKKKHVLASVASAKLSLRRKRKAEEAGEEWKPATQAQS
jgi:hypothetical protein